MVSEAYRLGKVAGSPLIGCLARCQPCSLLNILQCNRWTLLRQFWILCFLQRFAALIFLQFDLGQDPFPTSSRLKIGSNCSLNPFGPSRESKSGHLSKSDSNFSELLGAYAVIYGPKPNPSLVIYTIIREYPDKARIFSRYPTLLILRYS
jgi:hypothetical protein